MTFRFKQFAIRQDRCPMKVGTDGVLLGAWASVRPSDRRILDIGTGTGLIALMMAQRVPGAQVTGVDVEDVSQARGNADASPWGGRVAFVQCPVQEFAPQERFDLVVSNPPFFVDSLTCPDQGRTTARHAVRLPFDELCASVVRLLAGGGRFAVVLPTDEAARFIGVCRGKLALVRRTDVRTTPRHPVRRVLMEFVPAACSAGIQAVPGRITPGSRALRNLPAGASAPAGTSVFGALSAPSAASVGGSCAGTLSCPPAPDRCSGPAGTFVQPVPDCSELVIGTGEHEQYTPEYRALTRDFYLKF